MTIVTTNYRTAEHKIELGTLEWTGDIEENDQGDDLEPTYTIYLEDMKDTPDASGVISVALEVSLEWLTMHGIELFERGVPLDELTRDN